MASPTGQTGTARYSKIIQVPVTAEVDERIRADATKHRLSIAEVARTYLDAGIDTADALAAGSVKGGDWTGSALAGKPAPV